MNCSSNENLKDKLIVHQQQQLSQQRKTIIELKNDAAFLKKALAIALKDSCIVIREEEETPEFQLDENMGGEVIIRVVKNGG